MAKYFPLDPIIDTDIIFDNQKLVMKDYKNVLKEEVSNNKLKVNQINEIQSSKLLDHIHAKHFENGEIHIYNLTREDIQIENLRLDGKVLNIFENLIIKGIKPSIYDPYVLETDLIGTYDNRIEIATKLLDQQRTYNLKYTLLVDDIHNPLSKFTDISKLIFLKIKSRNYIIDTGKWIINSPIIVDKNLIIEKGTELLFNDGAYLIINGNLSIQGTEQEKLFLGP